MINLERAKQFANALKMGEVGDGEITITIPRGASQKLLDEISKDKGLATPLSLAELDQVNALLSHIG